MHYQHVADFLADQSSTELAGWIEYERMSDEIQSNRLTYAIMKAFQRDDKKATKRRVVEDDEEVIDTTQPDFAEKFQFTNTPQAIQQPRNVARGGTEIRMG